MYVDSLACVRVKMGESEWFGIDSGVRCGCIISPWLFNVYMDTLIRDVKMGIGMRGMRFMEVGREWRLPGLLYTDDLILCVKLVEDLRDMVGWFIEVFRKRGLNVNAGKSKVMVINEEEGLECVVHVDEICLENVS